MQGRAGALRTRSGDEGQGQFQCRALALGLELPLFHFPPWVTRGGLWGAVPSAPSEDKESGSSKWGQQEAGGVKEEQ